MTAMIGVDALEGAIRVPVQGRVPFAVSPL
jgi:hypothetical protein